MTGDLGVALDLALKGTRAGLIAAAIRLDQAAIESRLEDAVAEFGVEDTVVDAVLPVMRQIGERWATGQLGVAHEHVASQAVRSFFRHRPVPEPHPGSPTVVLACLPGELHDLPLVLFAGLLQERGCQTIHLGESTPLLAVAQVASANNAHACVVSSTRTRAFEGRLTALARLAQSSELYLAGAGTEGLQPPIGCTLLGDDFRAAADMVAGAAEPRWDPPLSAA